MNGLAVVSSLLLVPPVAMGIAQGTLLRRRVDVAAVLWEVLVGCVYEGKRGGYLAWVYDFGVDGSETRREREGTVDRGGSESAGERARGQHSSWEHLKPS